MKTIFLLLFVGFCAKGFAQDNLPVYEIKSDTGFSQNLDAQYWQMLPDKGNRLTITDIIKPSLTNRFFSRGSMSKPTDTVANTYWLRYRIKNVMSVNADVSLNSYSENDDFYVFDSTGNYKHFATGHLLEWAKKDGLKMDNIIPLSLAPGETITVYDRMHNRAAGLPQPFAVDIVNTAKGIENDYVHHIEDTQFIFDWDDLENVFLIGMLSIALLFNLFFFFIIKEKEYLYFSILVFSLTVARLINPLANYWTITTPVRAEYIGYFNLAWSFIHLSLVLFVRQFFKLSQRFPRFSKFLLGLGIAEFICNTAFELADPNYLLAGSTRGEWGVVYITLEGSIYISVLIVFFIYLRKRSRVTNLVITGGFPLTFLYGVFLPFNALCYLLNYLYGVPSPAFLEDFSFWTWEIFAVAWFVVLFTIILCLRFNELRKVNAQIALDKERLAREKETERALLIEQQKGELEQQVADRTAELKQSLEDLRAAQKQLIQQEKMASLGELTAGIAHEIQNPLNFVNNFSEVNKELIEEFRAEHNNPQVQADIINDIEQNVDKVIYHGRRADSIVKGMLQHSRTGSGKKEWVNINTLVDESLRLSFHGFRAKDKHFTATIHTDFDEYLDKINLVPQDISRVLLNLFNNAFYAVTIKQQPGGGFEPVVSVCTRKRNDRAEIVVKDNGNGIPAHILDKIFQPFFTTKPTGEGTGLGLSLSYDIIKAHGGDITVESKEGEGSEFVVALPE